MLKKIIALVIVLILADLAYLAFSAKLSSPFSDSTSTQAAPDFVVVNAQVSPNSPDFLITIGNSGDSPLEGSKLRVMIDGNTRTRNEAGEETIEAFQGHLYEGDITPPNKGESGTYTLPAPQFVFEQGVHEITVTLNGNQAITESDTANNVLTIIPQVPVEPHEGE
jgi:archaellum component FlaG (FlaF/FlaG flagellin family)